MSSTNPVDAAIAQAEANANQAQPAASQEVAVSQPQATAVAPVAQGGPLSLDDLTQGSMNVDDWLKVKEFGLLVGSQSGKFFESAEFYLDTSQVQPCEVVKFGNPATYFKTYDRQTCAQGGSWQEALNKAAQVEPNVRPYMSAELPLKAAEEIKASDGTVLAKEGDILGHSTSTTNYGNLSAMMKELKEGGNMGKTIKLKVGFEARTNANKQTWGVLTFEILEVIEG